MQMVKKFFLWFLLVWFALLLFMPKAELYYALEQELAKQDIRLNETSIDQGILYLTVRDVTVYKQGIALGKIESIHFFTLLAYSTLELKQIVVDDLLKSKVPSPIEDVTISHNIFAPLSVSLDANGSFGSAEGKVSFLENTMKINIAEGKEIGLLKPYLKQDKEGWYYETSF